MAKRKGSQNKNAENSRAAKIVFRTGVNALSSKKLRTLSRIKSSMKYSSFKIIPLIPDEAMGDRPAKPTTVNPSFVGKYHLNSHKRTPRKPLLRNPKSALGAPENNLIDTNEGKTPLHFYNAFVNENLTKKGDLPYGAPMGEEKRQLMMMSIIDSLDRLSLNVLEAFVEALKKGDFSAFQSVNSANTKGWAIIPPSEISEQFKSVSRDELSSADLVAEEIEKECVPLWLDRKNLNVDDVPWKGGVADFIQTFYKTWINNNTLKLSHLRRDMPLYNSYTTYVSRCKKANMEPLVNLPSETTRYTEEELSLPVASPQGMHRHVPVASLSVAQKKARRLYDAQQKKQSRKNTL